MVIRHHRIILPELKALLPSTALQPYMIEPSTGSSVEQLSMTYLDLLSFSAANNFSGLDGLPIDAAFQYLRHQSGVQFSHLMQSMEGLTARALSQKLFISAIDAKDARTVDMILRYRHLTGVDPNTAVCHFNGERYTPVERSAELHDFESTKVLLEYQADVNKTLSDRPLHPRGALSRSIEQVPFDRAQVSLKLVRLLLDHGARVCLLTLNYAISKEAEEVAEALFRAGLDDSHEEWGNDGIFSELISNMSHETCMGIVERVVDIGADINAPYFESDFEARPRMLDMAAKKGDFDLVRTLLDFGAQINDSTLAYAVQSEKTDLVTFLLEKGAKVDGFSYDDPPSTPLAEAIRAGKPELVQILEAQGALRHIREEEQYIPVLVAASAVGNTEMVRRLLQIRTDIRLYEALAEATKANHEEIATLLIGAGADVNEFFFQGYKWPLSSALKNRNSRIVRALLNADPKLDSSDLLLATEWGDISIIEDLLVAGCPISHKAMSIAIERRDWPLIKRFIAAGADLDASSLETALATAAGVGDIDIVNHLLLNGADPGDPSVLLRAMEGDSEMFGLLRRAFLQRYPHGKKGYCDLALRDAILKDDTSKLTRLQSIIAIDLSKHNGAFREHLALAIQRDNAASTEAVRMLLEAGADPNGSSWKTRDIFNNGSLRKSILQVAIESRKIRMAEILLDAGADINFPATRGFKRTPIQAAAESGCYEMVQMLIRRGANVDARAADRGGGTAIQLASIGGYIGIVELLLRHGADVNRAPSMVHGRSALEGAAENGRLDMVHFLLRSGFQIIGQDDHQRLLNAVRMAEENGHFVVAETLKSHLPQLQ